MSTNELPSYLVTGYTVICHKCGERQTFEWELFHNAGSERIRELEKERDKVDAENKQLNGRIERAKAILREDGMDYKGGPKVQMRNAIEALEGK